MATRPTRSVASELALQLLCLLMGIGFLAYGVYIIPAVQPNTATLGLVGGLFGSSAGLLAVLQRTRQYLGLLCFFTGYFWSILYVDRGIPQAQVAFGLVLGLGFGASMGVIVMLRRKNTTAFSTGAKVDVK